MFVGEEMISLSNVVKRTNTDEMEEKITIRLLTMNRSRQPHEETDGSIQSLQNNEYIEKAIEEANLIVERANQEADQIRRQIEKEKRLFAEEKEKIYQQAHHEGYSKGIQLGQEKGYREVEELIQFAKSIVDEAKIEYQNCVGKSEQTILTLSLKVAEKILCSSLNENEERFLPLVKKAIDEVKNYKEVQIYVNPSRYALLVKKKMNFCLIFMMDNYIFILMKIYQKRAVLLKRMDYGWMSALIPNSKKLKRNCLNYLLVMKNESN